MLRKLIDFREPPSRFLLIFTASLATVVFVSCASERIDLRTLVPSETIVYLETDNLGNVLNLISENENFRKFSTSKPDFATLEGIQVAIAVTDFETSEKSLTNQNSILNFTPKFVAVAETHAWSWQVESLVENQIQGFVRKVFSGKVKSMRTEENGISRFVWSAEDGRKAFAAISGTTVFFSNDEAAINSSISVANGTGKSLKTNSELAASYKERKGELAFGYVSRTGIAKIADIFGVSVAVRQTEDEDSRSAISQILSKVLRNLTEEIVWTANAKDGKFEDRVFIKTKSNAAEVFGQTIVPGGGADQNIYNFVPRDVHSITRYDLKNPQVAFRSLLLVPARSVDPVEGRLIAAFSNSLLEPYGIVDAEGFLSGIGSTIITAQIDEEGEKTIAIVEVKDREKVYETISNELGIRNPTDEVGDTEIRHSSDGEFSSAFLDGFLILGNSETVTSARNIWRERKLTPADPRFPLFNKLVAGDAPSITFTKDPEITKRVVRVLGKPTGKPGTAPTSNTLTETRFTKNGIERRYVSDFGIIGTLISQFDSE